MKPLLKQPIKTAKKQTSTLTKGLDRLERAIAHQGLASRREAKALILASKVKVNGRVVTETGFGIAETDTITIEGIETQKKEAVLLYKPRGLETSKTSPEAKDIKSKYKALAHLSPIGRLDKESEGLIIMTNDGSLTKALTKEQSSIGKEYKVTVRENITDSALTKMASGIVIDKIRTKPTITKRLSRHSFSIVLYEGRKHQIRRMCAAVRLTIESLVRIKIGHIEIGSMKAGTTKKLSPTDIERLKQ